MSALATGRKTVSSSNTKPLELCNKFISASMNIDGDTLVVVPSCSGMNVVAERC